MSDSMLLHPRIAQIDRIRTWAKDLLALDIDEAVKAEAREILSQVDEVSQSLNDPGVDDRPHIVLPIADMVIRKAAQRMVELQKGLESSGVHVQLRSEQDPNQ